MADERCVVCCKRPCMCGRGIIDLDLCGYIDVLKAENARLSQMVKFAGPIVGMLSETSPRCAEGSALYLAWAEHEGDCDECAALQAVPA